MYYSYENKIGGPLTYINTIINSELKKEHEFFTLFQNKAPGGLDISLLKNMVMEIKRIKPDIVHVHGAQSEGFYGVLAAKLAGKCKIVTTVHGFAFDDSSCKGLKRLLYKNIVEPFVLRFSDAIYCVCEFASKRDIVIKNTGKRNCGFIYNPVPQINISESRDVVRGKMGILPKDIVIAVSGRVTKDKGFPLIEEIVKELTKKNITNCKLLVIGDGAYSATFKNVLSQQILDNKVIMVGQTTHVFDYLNASDVFLFPSLHENLSIALLEACAIGLPAVVSNVGGNSEIVVNGKSGYVIDDFSKEKYIDALLKLIENEELRYKMGIFSSINVTEKFSIEKMCEEINEVYFNVF